jgi:hypothetical protein
MTRNAEQQESFSSDKHRYRDAHNNVHKFREAKNNAA